MTAHVSNETHRRWIKLHAGVLDDYEFSCLPDAEKWAALSGAVRGDVTAASRYVTVSNARLPWKAWRELRRAVFERDGYRCTYCGRATKRPECDHIVPVSRGGSDHLDNLTTACRRCNRRKHARLLSELPTGWRGADAVV